MEQKVVKIEPANEKQLIQKSKMKGMILEYLESLSKNNERSK